MVTCLGAVVVGAGSGAGPGEQVAGLAVVAGAGGSLLGGPGMAGWKGENFRRNRLLHWVTVRLPCTCTW